MTEKPPWMDQGLWCTWIDVIHGRGIVAAAVREATFRAYKKHRERTRALLRKLRENAK